MANHSSSAPAGPSSGPPSSPSAGPSSGPSSSASSAQLQAATAAAEASTSTQAVGAIAAPCPYARKVWIEIELVGEDGSPIADQRYLVVAPDGTEYRGRTDADGAARIDGIDPGNCQVSFPDLDEEAWK